MIYTVKIIYLDGTEDIKECHDIGDIVLDNVNYIKIIREEHEDHRPVSTIPKPTSSGKTTNSNN